MAFSRRIFLRHGVLAAAACASNPLMAFGARRGPIGGNEEGGPQRTPGAGSDNWQDHAAALDRLDRNAFSGVIGSSFKVFTGAGQLPVWVTLLAVEDLPAIAPVNPASFAVANKQSGFTPASSGFVLLFGGSSPVPQDTHLFEHQDLGRFALFTVPGGNGTSGLYRCGEPAGGGGDCRALQHRAGNQSGFFRSAGRGRHQCAGCHFINR